MVIVDTTVWIDYLRGESSAESLWLSRELLLRRIGLTDLILCEVLQGVTDEGTAKSVQRELSKFTIWPMGGVRLAVSAARNYRKLRESGRTVRKTIDCWIATFCIEAGHQLLHRDRDFEPFETLLGLRVVKPN
jgi:predicted nucleic acid-binding protein